MRLALFGGLVLAIACGTSTRVPIRFLALGDSYTIGESVAPSDRWPNGLARALRIPEPQIIAKTGWTTDELSAAIDAADPKGPFDLVTLLIGVNNQYRGRSADEYRQQFDALLKRAIGFAGGGDGMKSRQVHLPYGKRHHLPRRVEEKCDLRHRGQGGLQTSRAAGGAAQGSEKVPHHR